MFKKLFLFILNLLKNAQPFVVKNILPAINLVNGLKNIVNGDTIDLLTKLTPKNWDEKLVAKFHGFLILALDKLHVTLEITQATSITEKILLLVKYLQTKSPQIRNAFYHSLATEITKQSDESLGLKDHVISTLVAAKFSELKENLEDEINVEPHAAKTTTSKGKSKANGK